MRFIVSLLAVLFSWSAHAQTINLDMAALTAHTGSAATGTGGALWWGVGFYDTPVTFPSAGLYQFTISAHDASNPGGTTHPNLMFDSDYLPVDHGPDAVSNSNYIFKVVNTTPENIAFTRYITAGTHVIGAGCMNCWGGGNIYLRVNSISIAPVYTLPSEPVGARDPTIQPFRSYSIWNTAIGSGAQWSAPADLDTIDLRHAGATINSFSWSIPVYVAKTTDPLQTFTEGQFWAYSHPPLATNAPADMTPAPPTNGDRHITMFSADHRWMHNFFGCYPQAGGWACSQEEQDDVCSDGNNTIGWGIGLIRTAEVQAGIIPHKLRFALPTALTKGGDTSYSGLAWPATVADFCSPGCYTGHILYGSTIGIPASVDITSLGLTPSGLILARTLQDYGALQRDTGGSNGMILYAEQGAATAVPAQLTDMVNDLNNKIRPVLAVMRNQTSSTVNGGGTPRKPMSPKIDPAVCPNP